MQAEANIPPRKSRKGDLNSEPPLCRIRTLRQVQFRFCRSPHSGASAYSRDIVPSSYGNVPEEELDLIEFTASKMTQTCAGAPKTMRCERVLAFSSSFEILSLATASLTLALIVRERSSLRRFRRVIVEKCNLQRESVSGETSLISRRKGRYPDPMFRAEM